MDKTEMRQKIIKRLKQVVITTLVQAVLVFLSAGSLTWEWGWWFVGTYFLGILINALLLFSVNPAVIAERADSQDMRKWDQIWGSLAFLTLMLVIPILGGLDFRFSWSTGVSRGLHLAGVGLFFIGNLLFAWAMAYNAKFATVVRVGEEGSHPVAMGGPYRIVRHPGYLGACFQGIGLPLLFGSWWAYIAAAVAIFSVIVRTALEDKTLQEELPGYDKLVAQTRYRLIPRLW
ncbi:MAG: methyltransferase family protein [Anaerolineales bacterium]